MSWTGEYYKCSACGEVFACAYETCPTCHAPCSRMGIRTAVTSENSNAELIVTGETADAERIFLSKAMRFKRNDGRIDSDDRAQLLDFAKEFGIAPLRREELIEQVESDYERCSAPLEAPLPAAPAPLVGRSFDDFVLETARVLEADENVFLKGAIPVRKTSGASKAIMSGGNPLDILVLVDNTVFGGATDGVVLTEKGIWLKNMMEQPRQVPWEEISSANAEGTNLWVGCYEVDLTILSRNAVKKLADVISTIAAAFPRRRIDSDMENLYDWAVGLCSTLACNSDVYIGRNILPRKLAVGMDSMGVQEDPKDVFMQIDTTVFGGAKDGVILTSKAIYWKNIMESAHRIAWMDFQSAQVDGNSSVLINGVGSIDLTGSFPKSDLRKLVDVFRDLSMRFKNAY